MSSVKTKNAILNAALELFALKGFHGTSVREIALKSQANISAISYHFDSKEGLYKAVLLHCFGFIENIIENAPKTPLQALQDYALNMGKLHQQKPFIARFILTNIIDYQHFMNETINKCREKLYVFLKTQLQNGVKSGIFKENLNINSTIIAFVCLVNFYFAVRHSDALPSEFNNLEQIYSQNSIDIFFNGIVR